MNETFMKFLKSLSGPGAIATGGYNPMMQVQEGSGIGAAPWWAGTAFAGQRERIAKSTPTIPGRAVYGRDAKDLAIDRRMTSLDTKATPQSFTNDRERVAAKIAQASKKWKLPTTSPFAAKRSEYDLKANAPRRSPGQKEKDRRDILRQATDAQRARSLAKRVGGEKNY